MPEFPTVHHEEGVLPFTHQQVDILMLTAIDNQLVQATKLLGSQAGRTRDTIIREVVVPESI